MAKLVGIDLGTANSLICVKNKGIVLRTPTVAAISKSDRQIIALGKKAYSMLGKTPAGIMAIKPMRDGVVANPEVTAKMIRSFFEEVDAISFFSRPSAIICVPYNVTELEKGAVEEAAFEAGARSVALIEEPIAAAIGTGLKVGRAQGTMIVDVGGGTTEVAVISLGGIVTSNLIRVAGEELNESIVNYLARRRGIVIGETQAEALKIKIGSAHPLCDQGEMMVSGRSLETGLSAEMKILSAEIREAMMPTLEQIIQTVQKTLEQTPPELSSDIYDHGIILTGGGALLKGIDKLITERTNLKVRIPLHPLESVCIGILRVINSEGKMESVLQYRGR